MIKEWKMKRKIAVVALALVLILSMSLMLFACNSGNQPTDKDPGGNKPPQNFENPGDNLGGGGVGVLPDDTDSVTDDIEPKDFSDLESNTSTDGSVVNGSDDAYTISTAGTYVLSGDFKKGIIVSVGDKESVRLVLSGANVLNNDGIALSNTNKKSSLIITLADDTQNTITNSGDGVNAVHVKGSLSVNGKGNLSVTSGSKNAIKVSKGFEMIDANVTLSCENHGLSARFVEIHNATLNVTSAKKDGINAECDDDVTEYTTEEGYVILKDVNYTCSVDGDGIQADTFCKIDGGNINITTNGTFVKYSSANMAEYDLEKDDFRYIYSGGDYQKVASDHRFSSNNAYALLQSCKGIKVGEIKYDQEDTEGNVTEIVVTDGDYLISITGDCKMTINSTDDAIHTNSGDVLVESGEITISTYDDGITSDGLTEIRGGKIDVLKSYEGIEGAYVKISGGDIYIVASDDGINAATDDRAVTEYIIISGGNIIVNADGDGVDSNGSILVEGGSLIVYGPTSGGDAALDADSGIIINGGIVWACSTLGMVETPSTNSTQYVVSYAQQSKLAEGSVFTLKDSDGNAILSVDVAKDCQSIIFSTSTLTKGATYTIYCNDTLMSTFTVDGILTKIGTAQNAGPGGGGGHGPGGRPGGWW